MRNAFTEELERLAASDSRVTLLSGDIGNRLFDRFKEFAPERFFNCGVAEANMVGMAAGMAMAGLRPIVYTITPFVIYRALEQIRVDLCYHNLPVIIVGVGAGLSYAELNATHHSCEDLAFMRALPNMTVVCPADAFEVRAALRDAVTRQSPVYLRLGKKGEAAVHKEFPEEFRIGKALRLCEGKDVSILACGNIVPVAMEAAELLRQGGLSVGVVSFHTVKPLDSEFCSRVFAESRLVVSVEEHSIIGGFGGALAEWVVDHGDLPFAPLLRIGTEDRFLYAAGKQKHARKVYGLTAEEIARRVRERL